jgi:enoyl-CoA hydratase/carnithine racemase
VGAVTLNRFSKENATQEADLRAVEDAAAEAAVDAAVAIKKCKDKKYQ